MAAGQVLAGDAELAVGLAADREDDRVVEALEVFDLDVVADLDVAEEAEALAGRGFLVDPDHRLDLRVVGGDAAADQPEGGREAVEEVDLGVQVDAQALEAAVAIQPSHLVADPDQGRPRFLETPGLPVEIRGMGERVQEVDPRIQVLRVAVDQLGEEPLGLAEQVAGLLGMALRLRHAPEVVDGDAQVVLERLGIGLLLDEVPADLDGPLVVPPGRRVVLVELAEVRQLAQGRGQQVAGLVLARLVVGPARGQVVHLAGTRSRRPRTDGQSFASRPSWR